MSENTSKKSGSTLIHDALILFVITLVAAVALGFVYEITKEPIAAAEAEAKAEAYRAVFPEMVSVERATEPGAVLESPDGYDEDALAFEAEGRAQSSVIDGHAEYEGVTLDEINYAYDASGSCIGCIMTLTSSKGYGGSITMTMGVACDGTLKGIEFLDISETAGLGMKAEDEEFKSQFKDVRTDSFSLAKRSIEGTTPVDAISSATITTTAVTRMVNAGIKCAEYKLTAAGCWEGGNN